MLTGPLDALSGRPLILLSNDDGIDAPGLRALAEALGPLGTVAVVAPAQDEEFVISHADNVQATGFVEHLKLPHSVDFQAELGLVTKMRADFEAIHADGAEWMGDAAE